MCVIKKEKGRGPRKGKKQRRRSCVGPRTPPKWLPCPSLWSFVGSLSKRQFIGNNEQEELSKLRELRLCCTRHFHGVVCRSETNKFNTANAWGIKSFDLAEGLRCSMLVAFFVHYQSSAQLCATPALQQLELQGQSEGVSRHTGGKYLSIT